MLTTRRSLLNLVAAAGCACGVTAAGAIAEPSATPTGATKHAPHWSYEGETGPGHWGELSPDFKVCQLGLEQTPIDLAASLTGDPGSISFDYPPASLTVLNNGHTIQANVAPGSAVSIGGVKYELLQFHFHHRSEHLVKGRSFDMELHLVHKSAAGALAVVGVLITPGAANATLDPVLRQMPASAATAPVTLQSFDLAAVLPSLKHYYRYMGSLTTPPCSEGLTWTVFHDPIEASPEQIRAFADLFPNNARPVQHQHRRFVIETGN